MGKRTWMSIINHSGRTYYHYETIYVHEFDSEKTFLKLFWEHIKEHYKIRNHGTTAPDRLHSLQR